MHKAAARYIEELENRLNRVLDLHRLIPDSSPNRGALADVSYMHCAGCYQPYPCPTRLRAVGPTSWATRGENI